MNGEIVGAEEGDWTYIGASGRSVIDYVLENEEVRERIKRLEIGSTRITSR